MKKLTAIIILIVVFFSSCKHSKFLDRKYLKGKFVEKTKTLKHNTLFTDVTKSYASVDHLTSKQIIAISNSDIEQRIIKSKVNSICEKKDSIFIKAKKGKNQKIVKKNDQDFNVITFIDDKGAVLSQKKIPLRNVKPVIEDNAELQELNRKGNSVLLCSVVPVWGFIQAVKFKKQFNAYRKNHPRENLKKYSGKGTTAVTISIIISFGPAAFIIVLCLLALLVLLLSI